jgi:DNA integrity scanning protein DisA with diadenylate cyclase activity
VEIILQLLETKADIHQPKETLEVPILQKPEYFLMVAVVVRVQPARQTLELAVLAVVAVLVIHHFHLGQLLHLLVQMVITQAVVEAVEQLVELLVQVVVEQAEQLALLELQTQAVVAVESPAVEATVVPV